MLPIVIIGLLFVISIFAVPRKRTHKKINAVGYYPNAKVQKDFDEFFAHRGDVLHPTAYIISEAYPPTSV